MMENQPPLTSLDGSSNGNPPERCLHPLYSRESPQDEERKDIKAEIKEEEEEEMSMSGAQQSMGGGGPLYSRDYTQEGHTIPHHHQSGDPIDIEFEVEAEEETYMRDDQQSMEEAGITGTFIEEDTPTEISTGIQGRRICRTTSTIARVAAGHLLEDTPTSPIASSGNQSPNANGECPDEDSRPMDLATTGSRVAVKQQGRGGGRGRGRQPRGGCNIEGDDRLVALLQKVRQERRSVDVFLDPTNPRTTFCRSLYPILEDIGGDQEKLCMDLMYAIANEYRYAKLSGRLPPTFDP